MSGIVTARRHVVAGLVATLLVVALSGCVRTSTSLPWSLDQVTADGTVVAITVEHGGCSDFSAVELVETDDAVEIRAEGTTVRSLGLGGCSASLELTRQDVALAQPLGDRALMGCQRTDCRSIGSRLSGDISAGLGAGPGAVVRFNFDELVALDPVTGAERWRQAVAVDDLRMRSSITEDLVLLDLGPGVTALSARDGATRWTSTGAILDVDGSAAPSGLIAIAAGGSVHVTDVETGRSTVALPVGGATRGWWLGGDLLVLGGVDWEGGALVGSSTLTRFDTRTGTVRWTAEVAGGPTDLLVEDGTAVARVFGALYGFDVADGRQRWGHVPLNISALHLERSGEVRVFVGGDERTWSRLDPGGGALQPAGAPLDATVPDARDRPFVGDRTFHVQGEGLLVAEDEGGVAWSVDTRTAVSGIATTPDAVTIATPLGVDAYDPVDGELLWSTVDL